VGGTFSTYGGNVKERHYFEGLGVDGLDLNTVRACFREVRCDVLDWSSVSSGGVQWHCIVNATKRLGEPLDQLNVPVAQE
jgi:hypothetical protein